MNAQTAVAELAGVGPKRAEALTARGIVTVLDAALHLPARYQDWRMPVSPPPLQPDSIALVAGKLKLERANRPARWRRPLTGILVSPSYGPLRVVWFNLPSYLRDSLPDGQTVVMLGRLSTTPSGMLQLTHPEFRTPAEIESSPIRPIYRLPAQIGQRLWARIILKVLHEIDAIACGALAPRELQSLGMPSVADALRELHNPGALANLEALRDGRSEYHRALAFDEMFCFQLAMMLEKDRRQQRRGIALRGVTTLSGPLLDNLPFAPTRAQLRAMEEIQADLAQSRPMNRLLMGDVGSGKTLVAVWAMLRAVESGMQAVMMAPTELLAEQHRDSFTRLCGSTFIASGLLTGAVTGARRAALLRDFSAGSLPILFGTHALFQRDVKAARLGLVVIDEQHRFGVFERARLKELGRDAHFLMMTATPIPRSLAMMLFANLDLSVLDEIPPGRAPIETRLLAVDEAEAIEANLEQELSKGNRAFVVAPLIDGEDEPSVTEIARRLASGRLKRFRFRVLHGRMSHQEKERIMRSFRDAEFDVLVATTVVEVGIDVPAASIIVIFAAERYGLAQLHQLRGRVGRGAVPSRCLLVVSPDADTKALARLKYLVDSRDGAEVARADLAMRGPGDLLGARQAGALPLRFARFIHDPSDIELARRMASERLREDPGLRRPESEQCRAAIARMLSEGFSLGDVG
jgi:ATP-dependent DNA helicase RecG